MVYYVFNGCKLSVQFTVLNMVVEEGQGIRYRLRLQTFGKGVTQNNTVYSCNYNLERDPILFILLE